VGHAIAFRIRVPTTVGCRFVERRSGVARLSACCLTMRGARRSHNTIARTADRHPQSAPAVIRAAARDGSTGLHRTELAARGLKDSVEVGQRRGGPVTRDAEAARLWPADPNCSQACLKPAIAASPARPPRAREDRGRIVHHRRRLTKAQGAKRDLASAPPRLLLPCNAGAVRRLLHCARRDSRHRRFARYRICLRATAGPFRVLRRHVSCSAPPMERPCSQSGRAVYVAVMAKRRWSDLDPRVRPDADACRRR
jgi:hypothetical protein